jgi:small subunit ribosomal protein S3
MGQKVHPYGFRLGVTKTWRSRWFTKHDYAKLLSEDLELKDSLRERLKAAGVSSIEVDRPGNKLRITIHTSRPGIIIGRKGAEIEKLKGDLAKKTKREVFIDIQEVHKPELDAQLVSESIALQLEKRVAFRRAMRKSVDSALRFGCKGIKVRVSGRLNGAEIARTEWYLQGQLPLHTLRADIDYGFTEAFTTYGVIGIKCWVYKGEILPAGHRRATGGIGIATGIVRRVRRRSPGPFNPLLARCPRAPRLPFCRPWRRPCSLPGNRNRKPTSPPPRPPRARRANRRPLPC